MWIQIVFNNTQATNEQRNKSNVRKNKHSVRSEDAESWWYCFWLYKFGYVTERTHTTQADGVNNNFMIMDFLLEFASEHVWELVHRGIRDGLSDSLVHLLSHVWRQLWMGLLQLLGAHTAAHSRNPTEYSANVGEYGRSIGVVVVVRNCWKMFVENKNKMQKKMYILL